MTGEDSPTEKREEFNFGRSTPPPTTSHVTSSSSKQETGDVKTVAEPQKEEKDKEKEKDKDDKDEIDVSRPDANPGYDPADACKKEEIVRNRDKDDRDSDKDKDREGKKINGSDRLDGQWIPPKAPESKQYQDEEEDDNCTVKCLYYTMQCCECSIS